MEEELRREKEYSQTLLSIIASLEAENKILRSKLQGYADDVMERSGYEN